MVPAWKCSVRMLYIRRIPVACVEFTTVISGINGSPRSCYLGGYDCIEEAAEARHIAEEKLFGDFLKWYDTTYKKSNTNNRKKKEVGISLKR